MTYITGDTHGEFKRIKRFCSMLGTTRDDTMIILGDSGINYYTDIRRRRYNSEASRLPITLFCIHGNHEERAELLPSYKVDIFWGGKVMVDQDYPSIKFAIDGEVYKIPSKSGIKETIVIGGAYSVDKWYRLRQGANWYPSEQPSDEIKYKVEQVLQFRGNSIDIILSHTCPYSYLPREWFLSGIDQSTVDNSTELWLDQILFNMNYYEKWYCGHYHGNKTIDKIDFLFESIKEF